MEKLFTKYPPDGEIYRDGLDIIHEILVTRLAKCL